MALLSREGPVGIEIVRFSTYTTLQVFKSGLVHSAHRIDYKEITMAEALAWLAVQLRTGDIKL